MNKYTEKLNVTYDSFGYVLHHPVISATKCAISIDSKFAASYTSHYVNDYFYRPKAHIDYLDLEIGATLEVLHDAV